MEAYEAEATATGRPRLMLTAAVAAGKGTIDAGYEIAELSRYKAFICLEDFSPKRMLCGEINGYFIFRYLDFINVMTYDFHTSGESKVAHQSPLYKGTQETGQDAQFNTVSVT